MEPKMEQPKQYTPEEIAELEKSRTISDAELLKGGAGYVVNDGGGKEMRVTSQHMEQISGDFEKEAKADRTLVMSQVISDLEKFFEKGSKTEEDFKNEIRPILREVAYELLETQGHFVSSLESRSDSNEMEVVTCPHCQEIGLIFAGRLDLAKKIAQLFYPNNKDYTLGLEDLWNKRGQRIS